MLWDTDGNAAVPACPSSALAASDRTIVIHTPGARLAARVDSLDTHVCAWAWYFRNEKRRGGGLAANDRRTVSAAVEMCSWWTGAYVCTTDKKNVYSRGRPAFQPIWSVSPLRCSAPGDSLKPVKCQTSPGTIDSLHLSSLSFPGEWLSIQEMVSPLLLFYISQDLKNAFVQQRKDIKFRMLENS